MIPIRNKWCMMLDINYKCAHGCTYCTKYIRHLTKDKRKEMTLEQVDEALYTLRDWPNQIGLTGGDPLNHSDFEGLCKLIQKRLPKRKVNIFTSSPRVKRYQGLIDSTFGEVYINDHSKEQQEICKHQPNTIALDEVVEDPEMRIELRDSCWCNEMWSPIISPNGAFFCDLAAGLDNALGIGGGYAIEPGWWQRDSYKDQMELYCGLCGICVPWKTQAQSNKVELFTPRLLERFKQAGLRNLDKVEVVTKSLTNAEVFDNMMDWHPWRNREDKAAEGPAYVNV